MEPATQLTLNSVEYNETMVIDWRNGKLPLFTRKFKINKKNWVTRLPSNPSGKIGEFVDSLIEMFPEKLELQSDGQTIYLPLEKGTARALSTDEYGNMVWTELEAVTRHPPINKDGTSTLVKITTESGRTTIATKAKSFLTYKDSLIVEKEGSALEIGDIIPIVKNIVSDNVKNLKLNIFDYKFEKLPLEIPLTNAFGFLLGAYIAEGSISSNRSFKISNEDSKYRIKSAEWCKKYDIGYSFFDEKNDTGVRIYSKELTYLMETICYKGSYFKSIPFFAYSASDDFVKGMLDAILSGDGWVNQNGSVGLDSRSQYMRDGVGLLLNRFEILSRYSIKMEMNKSDKKDKTGEMKPMYRLYISNRYIFDMEKLIQTVEFKRKRLLINIEKNGKKPSKCSCGKTYTANRSMLYHKEHSCVETNYVNNVFLDSIVKIEDYKSSHPFVYDLTVEKTRNMVSVGGINLKDTFHLAGISSKNVTLGIPRLTELINVSKNMKTPSVTIYLCPGALPETIISEMEFTALKHVILKHTRDPLPDLFLEFQILESETKSIEPEELGEEDEEEEEHEQYEEEHEQYEEEEPEEEPEEESFRIIPSDDDSSVLGSEPGIIESESEIEPEYAESKDEEDEEEIYHEHKKYTCIELDSELCIAKGITMEHIVQKMYPTPVLCSSENSERWLLWCEDPFPLGLHLKGVKNINKIVMRESNRPDGEKEWVLDTDGTNLQDVLAFDGVDPIRTMTNDVVEISRILGIEAGRKALLNEVRNVISFDGTYVNYRHLSILVDTMTYRPLPLDKGCLLPMTRHGLKNVESASVLHKSSFEETVDVLSTAAIFSERDDLEGITSSIMMGKLSRCGTGIIDIVKKKEPESIKFEMDPLGMEFDTFDPLAEPTSFSPKGFEVPEQYSPEFSPTQESIQEFSPDQDFSPAPELISEFKYIPSSPRYNGLKQRTESFHIEESFGFISSGSGYIPSSPGFNSVKLTRSSGYIPSSPSYIKPKKFKDIVLH